MNVHREAALALDAGDVIGALQKVALRDDAWSLAIRGTAMARIGDLDRARSLLRQAGRGLGFCDRLAHARCVLAQAEVQLALRDGGWPAAQLSEAYATFLGHRDLWNAAYLKLVEARRAILLNRLDEAERFLAMHQGQRHPVLDAVAGLLTAHICLRKLCVAEARTALASAFIDLGPHASGPLRSELLRAEALLEAPVAGRRRGGCLVPVTPDALKALNLDDNLIVDATRLEVRLHSSIVPLVSRPVLFSLMKSLATVWPRAGSRADLIRTAFGGRHADETYRVRLRMEMMRLRRLLRGLCNVTATAEGYRLDPLRAAAIVLLEPLVATRHPQIIALLSDGEAWTSHALAEATGSSRRSVQRALEALRGDGLVLSQGAGPSHRWRTEPVDPITTPMLLSQSYLPTVQDRDGE
ncbi:helix-turn-helix domain-containing protein [Sphingobium sp. TomMM35A]